MSGQASLGERWVALAQVNKVERAAAMRPLLDEVLALEPEQRRSEVLDMVRSEYQLDDRALADFTASRLRAWLALGEEDRDSAETLDRAYDDALDQLPGGLAMRRTTVVQSVARSELTTDEIDRLVDVIPSTIRQIPWARAAVAAKTTSPAKSTTTHSRWKFWTHGTRASAGRTR